MCLEANLTTSGITPFPISGEARSASLELRIPSSCSPRLILDRIPQDSEAKELGSPRRACLGVAAPDLASMRRYHPPSFPSKTSRATVLGRLADMTPSAETAPSPRPALVGSRTSETRSQQDQVDRATKPTRQQNSSEADMRQPSPPHSPEPLESLTTPNSPRRRSAPLKIA